MYIVHMKITNPMFGIQKTSEDIDCVGTGSKRTTESPLRPLHKRFNKASRSAYYRWYIACIIGS